MSSKADKSASRVAAPNRPGAECPLPTKLAGVPICLIKLDPEPQSARRAMKTISQPGRSAASRTSSRR